MALEDPRIHTALVLSTRVGWLAPRRPINFAFRRAGYWRHIDVHSIRTSGQRPWRKGHFELPEDPGPIAVELRRFELHRYRTDCSIGCAVTGVCGVCPVA